MLKQIKTKEDAATVSRDAAYKMMEDAIKESPWGSKAEVNGPQLDLLIKLYLDHPSDDRGLFMAFDDFGLLIGLLACVKSDHLVVTSVASELMWYVSPEYRTSGIGIEMIKAFEKWAKDHGCNLVTLAYYQNEYSDSLAKLYDKIGYQKIETTYLKELN